MLINDTGSDQVIVINSLAISRFTSNEFNGSYPSLSTGALIRSNDTSYFNGGNVGIGNTSPNNKLEISDTGTGTGSTHLKISRGADSSAVQRIAGIKMGNTASNDGSNWIIQADSSLGYFDSADLDFIHNAGGTPSTRMTITSGGDVQIHGGDIFLNSGTNYNDKGVVYLSHERTAIISDIVNLTANGDTSLDFQTRSSGSRASAMFIDEFRNVGIGTTSPSAKLDVRNDDGVGNGLHLISDFSRAGGADAQLILGYFANGSAVTGPVVYAANGYPLLFSSGSVERMRIDSSGNVGIGLTSPTYKFHVASSNNVSIFEDTSGASGAAFCLFNAPSVFAMGSITRNGTSNAVLFNTSSDYRLKEDLQDFNALDLVDNITAYDYKWKDTEQRDYGFVAHELQEVMPNVVTGEKDGEMMQGVDYAKLTPVLLKAIQELKAEIETLKAQINN